MKLSWCAAIIAALSSIAFWAAGWKGGTGYFIGVAGSALNLWSWYALIGLAGRVSVGTEAPRLGTSLIVLAFSMKLPIFVALFFLTRTFLGGEASGCFLGGLVLVYSASVAWALGRT